MSCNDMSFPSSFFLQMQTNHNEEDQDLLQAPMNPCNSNLHTSPLARNWSSISEPDEEFSDDDGSLQQGEKKKRLSIEQVRTLEKSFEIGNKLEPERKIQLAKALGLKPRQVAIWFQNRRARSKTKQLERDYDSLKRQFEAVRSENEALVAQNKKLQSEIMALKGREGAELINLNKETEASLTNLSNTSSEINLEMATDKSIANSHHGLPFYPSVRPQNLSYFMENSTNLEVKRPKSEIGFNEGSFSSLLCGVEENSSFWPWTDRHNFN
ncbi:hypothetical protein LUZ63_008046 [Rhynchospora breviuscula]|uniref:Homeobox-leucine zipper protein n=1 Tax=Rhynchospora breviuscula TaxID=2022672 RepID=A0A9Q0CST9_9POAL|nr:hypothetical protein LUZ63_008046 [Rhynchospora breviuscula]